MENLGKHKSILVVGTLVLLFTGAFLLGVVYMQHRTENAVRAQSTETEMEVSKDVAKRFDDTKAEEEARQKMKDVEEAEKKAQEAMSMELAKYILEEMPDAPLLQENAEEDWGDSSLENYVNEINAVSDVDTKGAKNVIIKVCKAAGIDINTARVRDLTAEQIAQIDEEVFQNSDHPKD